VIDSQYLDISSETYKVKVWSRSIYTTESGVKKKKIQIFLEKDLADRVYTEAVQRYGRSKGALSQFFSDLLRNYFDYGIGAPVVSKDIITSKIEKVFNNILMLIASVRNTSIEKIHEITENEILRAIYNIRGSDPRTIRKWLNIFLQNGYLEYVGGKEPKRIFRIVRKSGENAPNNKELSAYD